MEDSPRLDWYCRFCQQMFPDWTFEQLAEHWETIHGFNPDDPLERWPDGEPVVDESDVPERLLGDR